jgi:hypothetical protein
MDIKTAKELIHVASIADDTVLLEGPHGIGKSNIVKQFAKENEYHLEELFLSNQEVGDLIGIPFTHELDGETITSWSVPIWLKRMRDAAKDGKRTVVFLDELNRAPIDVRQTALQLVLERKIHEHELPIVNGTRTFVIAAINPADEYQVDELDPALIDRFLHVAIEADVSSFLEYAEKKNLNRIICDFISENPDRLHYTPADGGIGSTPRSWEKLSSFLDIIENQTIRDDVIFQIMKGKIGKEIGAQFFSFYKSYTNILKVEDIVQIVEENKENFDEIDSLSQILSDLMQRVEPIRKMEIANQLKQKYAKSNDMLPFLVYLYSLEIEMCVSFLKSFRADDPDGYKRLAMVDSEVNDKQLFKRIVEAAGRD